LQYALPYLICDFEIRRFYKVKCKQLTQFVLKEGKLTGTESLRCGI